MLQKTRGIVLRHINYAENSIIVYMYTEHFGRQAYIVSGVRSKKAGNTVTLLQPLFILELDFYYKANRDIQRLKEIKNSFPFATIPFNIVKSTIALFISEVLYKTLKEEAPNDELFRFLFNSIQFLDLNEEGTANFHLLFLLRLTKYLGFLPVNNHDEKNTYFDMQKGVFKDSLPLHKDYLNKADSGDFARLLSIEYENDAKLKFNSSQRFFWLDKILHYYKIHIEGLGKLNSLEIFQSLFHH